MVEEEEGTMVSVDAVMVDVMVGTRTRPELYWIGQYNKERYVW
jgi:hypothetical protein